MVSKEFLRELNDFALIKDETSNSALDRYINDDMKSSKKNNLLVIYDEQGNEIGRTHNKVVSTGRIETIETLFRVYDISDKNNIIYDRPDNRTNPRWISTFGVGSGGAPMSEGMNPYLVNSNDTELTSPLVFRKESLGIDSGYWDQNKKKDFDSIYLNYDKKADDVYALLVCSFSYEDLKGQVINEIGLYNCNHTLDPSGKIIDKTKFSLYAKANMNSINKSPLNDASSFKIAYKVFI